MTLLLLLMRFLPPLRLELEKAWRAVDDRFGDEYFPLLLVGER